jgi:RNA polymerase sigma-70 factor (ECF subfamily)
VAALDRALYFRGGGPYVLQAAIASLQTAEALDWAEVAAFYAQLVRLTGSPVVELNRAVAVAEAGSPEAALEIIERLSLDDYLYLHSTRGELLRRPCSNVQVSQRTARRQAPSLRVSSGVACCGSKHSR